MEAKLSEPSQNKNAPELAKSLEQVKEELSTAFLNFKDLRDRCVIDIKEDVHASSDENKVFYFRPETFLLDDTEKQRQYRETLLKKISGIPKPEPLTYLGDEIHRSFSLAVADRSGPRISKSTLADFYQRRQYKLQHLKYKLLCRWAHHTLTSESLERIGSEATFLYGKLEFNLEQAYQRYERLVQEDYYDTALPENRPSTRAELDSGALYVEKFDLEAQSLIREDDVEVYLRQISYRNKVSRMVDKYLTRLKWLPMQHRYEIFEGAVEMSQRIKKDNINEQKNAHKRIQERTLKSALRSIELENELREVLDGYYCKRYEQYFVNNLERVKHSWKSNHCFVPQLISDQAFLKMVITDKAAAYGMVGDIDLDHGYSFSYQVTVFFPTYFQKQVIKSQFSVYDLHALEEDNNQMQKRTLNSMIRIDKNIFADISTSQGAIPSDEALNQEFRNNKNIRVMRVKSAAYWLSAVCLTPTEPEWHAKQQALIGSDTENPIDKLLESGLNFLDVNDLATVNRINEDNALLHQQNQKRLLRHNPHFKEQAKVISTSDGEKRIQIDYMPLKNSVNQASQLEDHLLRAVQDLGKDSSATQNTYEAPQAIPRQSLRYLPAHLLVCFYTLRFMNSRDCKTRILYTLNFFRAIQKRLSLDLREFGTRERMETHLTNPMVHSNEANPQVVNSSRNAVSMFDKKSSGGGVDSMMEEIYKHQQMTVFDESTIRDIRDMASMRMYKCSGFFNNRVFSTCPSYPKFHDTYGEPVQHSPECDSLDNDKKGKGISEKSIKLMGRIDHIEINEELKEVYVKDDFQIYILYDCVFQDMKILEQELVRIGSFYINRSEVLQDPTDCKTSSTSNRPYPVKDRLEVLDDLLSLEAEFQFKKVKLVQCYMECYEHICDPVQQQRIMQIITDIMARRPRLNLFANYFTDSYTAEFSCLDAQFELIQQIVQMQIKLEKTENKRLQDSLNLSYTLANQFEKNMWKYDDAQSLLSAIQKTAEEREANKQQVKDMADRIDKDVQAQQRQNSDEDKNSQDNAKTSSSADKKSSKDADGENEGIRDSASSSDSFNEEDYFKNDENQFTALLGLPQVTIETIYANYREKDQNVLQMMNENANFIVAYEGYPEFLTQLMHKSIIEKNRLFKLNSWSQDTGALDFYESLDFAVQFFAVMTQAQTELCDVLKPHDPSVQTCIETMVARKALEEFHNLVSYFDGTITEYDGRQYVEDESVMGNSEKQVFYAKEMVSDLSSQPKHLIDPFLVAKLDIQTINFFTFTKLPQDLNKYTKQKRGVSGIEYLMETEKEALAGLAKQKVKHFQAFQAANKVGDVLSRRNIAVPSLLHIYCNLIELHRIRNEVILAASETQLLAQIYNTQKIQCSCNSFKVELSDAISFDELENQDSAAKLVDFVNDGPAAHLDIGLAIREFDTALLSNFDFRNPDSFKFSILKSGLEEARGILQYQLLQKFLLLVAVRQNQLVLDQHQRAFAELNLVQRLGAVLPNPVVSLRHILSRACDGVDPNLVKEARKNYQQNLSTHYSPVFFNIQNRKTQSRSSISKEYSNYQNTVSVKFQTNQVCTLRVMRCFKLKLLTRFVQNAVNELCLDAQKIQAVAAVQRLRYFNRIFQFDPKALNLNGEAPDVFRYETKGLFENFPAHYQPQQEDSVERLGSSMSRKQTEVVAINTQSYSILDYAALPSSFSLLKAEGANTEDTRKFKERILNHKLAANKDYSESLKEIDPELNQPEMQLQQMLPAFTPIDIDAMKPTSSDGKGLAQLDYQEGIFYGESQYTGMVRYYLLLERIMQLEWFVNKIQFKTSELIHLDTAVESGMPFWQEDDFDARISSSLGLPEKKPSQSNSRIQDFIVSQIVSLRQKRVLAEEVNSFAQIMSSLIQEYQRTKQEQRTEYLQNYQEFRYLQIIGSFHKLIQQFYQHENMDAVEHVKKAIATVTKMDHLNVIMASSGNFNVNSSLVHPSSTMLEAQNIFYGASSPDEITNFRRSIRPIINEKALEPPQVTLFQSIYQSDPLRRSFPSQFLGQTASTNTVAFKALETALIGLQHKDRVYSQSFITQQKYLANDFMETVFGDTSMASLTNEDVYSLSQLNDAKKFLTESTMALLLRTAVICWSENSTLPTNIAQHKRYEKNFRDSFFWKLLKQKETLQTKLGTSGQFGQVPTQSQIEKLKLRIDDLDKDFTLATKTAEEQRDEMVKALRVEFGAMKKKVTLDQYFTTKAEIQLFSNEIEKFLIRASVRALQDETAALAKCFTLQVPTIQMHIHPFQQFAATFFDRVDPNQHLDVVNKLSSVQVFLTKLKNRGTEVETLTSGPGMVFTVKDINECMIELCRALVKQGEPELKSRSDLACQQDIHYRHLLYEKDQRIECLEHRMKNVVRNLENVIDARMFEKGNQLIYELDSANRLLALYKQALYDLEQKLYEKIQGEQQHKFKRKENLVEKQQSKFVDYQTSVANMVRTEFSQEHERIKVLLKEKANVAKNIEPEFSTYQSPEFYPANGIHSYNGPGGHQAGGFGKSTLSGAPAVLPGAVVPPGFKHYSYCSCFKPNDRNPRVTLELAEIEMMSEQEARFELARMCDLVRKQRLLWRTKEMCSKQKYQDQINLLTKQQSNNSYLWEQMAESQKRERVLQQELKFTQQSLSAAEKVIDKLQEEMKVIEADRSRLLKYKSSKAERLKELEDKVKKIEIFENIDSDKLLAALHRKTEKLKELDGVQEGFESRLLSVEQRRGTLERKWKVKLHDEQQKTQKIVDKMEQMKLELKMLETNDSSVASIWKKKCLDLFEVCQSLKQENEELRTRCKELIEQGISLADAIGNSMEPSLEQLALKNERYDPPKSFADLKSSHHPMVSTANTLKQVPGIPEYALRKQIGSQNLRATNADGYSEVNTSQDVHASGQGEKYAAWALRSAEQNRKQNQLPLSSQMSRPGRVSNNPLGNSLLSSGLHIAQPSPYSRPKNDLKSILTGTGTSFNPERSVAISQDNSMHRQQQQTKQVSTALTQNDRNLSNNNQTVPRKRPNAAVHMDSLFQASHLTQSVQQPARRARIAGVEIQRGGGAIGAQMMNTGQIRLDLQGTSAIIQNTVTSNKRSRGVVHEAGQKEGAGATREIGRIELIPTSAMYNIEGTNSSQRVSMQKAEFTSTMNQDSPKGDVVRTQQDSHSSSPHIAEHSEH